MGQDDYLDSALNEYFEELDEFEDSDEEVEDEY